MQGKFGETEKRERKMVSSTCNRQWNSNATFPFYLVEFHPKIQSGNNKNRVTRDTQNMEEEPSSLFFVSQKIKKKRGDNEWLLIITSSCTYGLNIVHRNSAVSALFVGLPSHTAYCSSCGNTHPKRKRKKRRRNNKENNWCDGDPSAKEFVRTSLIWQMTQ